MNILAAALCLAAGGPQEPEKLTLKDAVRMTLAGNSEIQIARFDPWIEEQSLLATYGVFDHVLFSRYTYDQLITPGTTFFSGAAQLEQITHDFSLGVRKRYPLGIQAELSLGAHATQSNSAFALLNPTWQDSLGLTLTLPILRDAGSDANNAVILVQKGRRDAAVDTFEISLNDSLFATAKAYHELIFALENRRLAERSLDLSKRLLQENERKLAQGLIPRLQVMEAQAQVAQKEQDMIRAEQTLANANDRLRRQVDPATLGRATSVYVPLDTPVVPREEIDETALYDRSIGRAFEFRADIRRAKRAVETAEIQKLKADRDALPRFDLLGKGSLLGVDDTIEDAFHRVFKFDNYELMGGFSFELPIENSSARYAAIRSALETRKAQASQRDLESRILLEVREAVRDLKTQQRTLKSADEQVKVAEERFQSETLRHQQGLTTTYFVLVSQNDLNAALLNQLRARIDFALSEINLKRVTGTLLEQYGVDIRRELAPRE